MRRDILYSMNDTVFGKIIRGEIPATKIYEDKKVLAFLDINPVEKGHILVIPKEHFTWMQDVPDDILSYSFIVSKKLMHAIKKSLGSDYVEISVVGTEIPHFHIHLIPKKLESENSNRQTYNSQEEMLEYAEKIIGGL